MILKSVQCISLFDPLFFPMELKENIFSILHKAAKLMTILWNELCLIFFSDMEYFFWWTLHNTSDGIVFCLHWIYL